MDLGPWTPLASSQPTPNLANYVIPTVTLLYLAGSLNQCNILAKASCQAINLYLIVYALNGFEPPDLPSYVTKVLSSILGYYTDSLFDLVNFIEYSQALTTNPGLWKTCNALKDFYQIVCGGKEITICPLIFNRKYNNLLPTGPNETALDTQTNCLNPSHF
ncbi:hypothetical protein DSO57_1007584 [Entomophthora muscae]|uniref:Uncharacterized protein n=1 Tax=Entomophthora muscae TaxID=34485 RepID=A0ACC2S9Q1_9FUNG|nr:hypothetical protein DSO57_1007584 [Entomophthora muscae]